MICAASICSSSYIFCGPRTAASIRNRISEEPGALVSVRISGASFLSMATAAPKRARLPHRCPLLSLWARNDLSDSVVKYLPTAALPKLPVISRPFRAAQPLVLFTAARRLGAHASVSTACLDALLAASPPERYRFHERWTQGLTKWQKDPQRPATNWEHVEGHIFGETPSLQLIIREPSYHGGFYRDFSSLRAGRDPTIRRFRVQIALPRGVNHFTTIRCVQIIGNAEGLQYPGGEDCIGALQVSYLNLNEGPSLIWLSRRREGHAGLMTTELCDLEIDRSLWYTVEASFTYSNDLLTTAITVTVQGTGINWYNRYTIQGAAMPLKKLMIGNSGRGEVHYGDLDVDYDA